MASESEDEYQSHSVEHEMSMSLTMTKEQQDALLSMAKASVVSRPHTLLEVRDEESDEDEADDGPLFSTRIVSHLGPVRDQVDSGLYWTRRLVRMASQLEALEKEYSKKLAKVLEHEKAKQNETKNEKMPRAWHALIAFQSALARIAQVHAEAGAAIKRDFVKPLDDAHKEMTMQSKAVFAEAEATNKQLSAAVEKVKKTKAKTEAVIKVREQAKEKDAQQDKGARWSRLSTLFLTTSADASAKVVAAATQYDESIEAANEGQKK
jgi:hypothetical protein